MFYFSVTVIAIGALWWFFQTYWGREDWRVLSPFGVLMLSYLYYCSMGPLITGWLMPLDFQGIDFRDGAPLAAMAALISFISAFAGYYSLRKSGQVSFLPIDLSASKGLRTGIAAYVLFLLLVVVSKGFNLKSIYNIFGNQEQNSLEVLIAGGGVLTYFNQTVSCLVAAVLLVVASGYRRLGTKVIAILLALNSIAIFTATGFRLRILFFLLALASLLYMQLRGSERWRTFGKLKVLFLIGGVAILGGALIVLMSSAREYGRGVDLTKLAGASSESLVANAFSDSGIYYTGGLTMEYVRETNGYTGLETFKAAGLRMIPSQIIGEKALPLTLQVVSMAMGGTEAAVSAGFAVPFFGENFISFGWLGVILGSLLLGAACAMAERMVFKKPTGLRKLGFCLLSGYMFIYFHRGYFPQQLDYFMFMVLVPLAFFASVNAVYKFSR